MVLTLEDLIRLNPKHTLLPLSQADLDAAQAHIEQTDYSNQNSRDRAYQNFLTLQALSQWFQKHFELSKPPQPSEPLAKLPEIWDVVNGTAIVINNTRFVLIPSDAIVLDELAVPQEWMEIPDWAATYYLAVHIHQDFGSNKHWLHVLGYASYQQLKQQAKLDPIDRQYVLSRSQLGEDLECLWALHTSGLVAAPQVARLPQPTGDRLAELDQLLAQIRDYSPRLDCAFSEWAFVLTHESKREQLYAQRTQPLIAQSTEPTAPDNPVVQLRRWLKGIPSPGWTLAGAKTANARGVSDRNDADDVVILLPQTTQERRVELGDTAVIVTLCVTVPDAAIALDEIDLDNAAQIDNLSLDISVAVAVAPGAPLPISPLELVVGDSEGSPEFEDVAEGDGTKISVEPFSVVPGEGFTLSIISGGVSSNLLRFKA